MFTSFCFHACQSLLESLSLIDEKKSLTIADYEPVTASLPFLALISSIRNLDLHCAPLPACLPDGDAKIFRSDPRNPMTLTSFGETAVVARFKGAKPDVKLFPKNLKGASFTPGDSVSYQCRGGELVVHDYSTGKDIEVLRVLHDFLSAAGKIVGDLATAEGLTIFEEDRSNSSGSMDFQI